MRVLVTGGARRIGAAIAREMAARGHAIALHHHHSPEEAEALATELRGSGAASVCVLSGELADPATPAALIAAARAQLGGPIAAVVNNASLFAFDRPPIADYALLDRHMHINLAAPVALAMAMAAQDDLDDGAVVNLLDQKLANLNPDFFSYTCSKLALEGATTMLAQALAPRIRVNAVSPGLTLPSLDQTADEFAQTARQNLLERAVDAGDIARTVAHLIETRSITGQNVFVDCGQRFVRRDGDVMFSTRARPEAGADA
ncbi:SDR family oxidoreductase [Sphingomonas hengshuiensis]|uniref:Short-chain dehydrogenase n=1 Tax=Sphingomonas hengshuiensis TaxID=1609977 RepID=A0A7U4LFC4_9SPHN|nr:SDR family oxidoreductase [Sphingomonas hengshuiensis]AJP72342.1 short-chain dehydrogenase [Sphingomonas hengshuiensis]